MNKTEAARLKRDLEALREEVASVRRNMPSHTMVSNAEFLALFQAHRNLSDEVSKLRDRVASLERSKR